MKISATFILIMMIFSSLSAQQGRDASMEVGFAGGTAYYLGEINRTHFGGTLKPGGGAFFRKNFDKRWSLNTGIHYFEVGASDAQSPDPGQQNRNLHFKNPITEFSVLGELNFFPYQVFGGTNFISPYLFLGLSYFNMNPQAQHQGFWQELQPIGTEGQGTSGGNSEKYSLGQLSVPYGIGIKCNITGRLACNITYGMRATTTDYLDDVSTVYADPQVLARENPVALNFADPSFEQIRPGNANVQRGDPANNDFYAFTTFALCLRIDKLKGSCWGGPK